MSRFFYTDPLAAAWMQVHFGMKLECPKASGDMIHASVNRETRAFVVGHLAMPPFFKAYVHLDSLPLLKPQVGDLCRLHWLDGSSSVREWEAGDDLPEAALDRDVRVKPAIIQRNGLAFHQPKESA